MCSVEDLNYGWNQINFANVHSWATYQTDYVYFSIKGYAMCVVIAILLEIRMHYFPCT